MLRSIGFLVLTNLAVMVILSIVLSILEAMGLNQWLAEAGISYDLVSTLIVAMLFGFGGSIISLLISKWMAKRSFKVQIIDPQTNNPIERWLYDTVKQQARQAGIGMPEVGYSPMEMVNAFATGANKNNALVVVTAGLVNNMNKREVEAVLGHEVSHVANGDMITMTLIQGVLNTFVIFLSRIIGMLIDSALRRGDNSGGYGIGYFVGSIVGQIVLGMLASVIAMAFSRWREYRADAGGANLAGRDNMIAALQALQRNSQKTEALPDAHRAFGIVGLHGLFLSHPPLEKRIAALQNRA